MKNFIRALSIVLVLMLLRGIASENRVELRIIVNKYSFCDLVLGIGPTQSIIMCEKGSSKVGLGVKGPVEYFGWTYHLFGKCGTLCTTLPRPVLDQANKNVVKFCDIFYISPNDQILASHVPILRLLICVLLVPQSGTLFCLSHHCHIL